MTSFGTVLENEIFALPGC